MNDFKRVGFIIDGLLPSIKNCYSTKTIAPLFCGWMGSSSIGNARLNPILSQQCLKRMGLKYEVFRPWQRYDAIVFLKSMNKDAQQLALKCKIRRIPAVFDLNVDYLSSAAGTFYYQGMAPTQEQNAQARVMARTCAAIVADSNQLNITAREYNENTVWIPDCIEDGHIQKVSKWRLGKDEIVPLLWSGEAVKLFDLLAVEDVLRSLRKRFVLRIVTNSVSAINKIFQPWQDRLKQLLIDLNVEIIPFHNLEKLLSWYDQGGVFISPRFLDNTYNIGHTEWKITLPMARGRMVLCSPQKSYIDVARFANGKGIRICNSYEDWFRAFEELTAPSFDWENEQENSCQVVRDHYSASVVGAIHGNFIAQLLTSA